MKRLSVLTLIILAGSSAHALAAATADGAARLTAVFQSYLGSEPGVVTVTPDGDSYDAKFDFAPLFAMIKEPGFSATVSPIEMTLTDQGGGKWQVDQDQALSFELKAEGKVEMKGSIASIKGTGVFDEALGTFASSTSDYTQFAFQQTVTDTGGTASVAYTIAAMRNEIAMAAAGDGADGTMKQTFSGLRETISMPVQPGSGMPPMDFTIEAVDGSQDATLKGLKPHGVNGLAAWLVAHPSPDLMKADQAVLKDRLRAALPLFQNIASTTAVNGMSVNTMMGRFGATRLDVLVNVNGVVEDGFAQEKFTVSGLTLPQGIVPPFAADLVPENFTLDFSAAGFNLAAPARLIIDNFDLTKTPPLSADMEPQLLQALLPTGSMTLGLGPSEVIAKLFDLKAEGNMTAGPTAMPAGQALVKLKGLDEVMAALQAAPAEMGMQQMAPMIIVAKGMAKTEPDGYLSWKIESTPTGSVTINGVDPMKMGGQ